MRIYTKSGDKGFTGLINGKRVPKTDLIIRGIGDLDELNAIIGILRALKPKKMQDKILQKIQNDIFLINSALADPHKKLKTAGMKPPAASCGEFHASARHEREQGEQSDSAGCESKRAYKINACDIKFLEQNIDILENRMSKLTKFITPGGNFFQALCHFARTVCRRAERAVLALNRKRKIAPEILIYLNRLSDLLFMLCRS